MTFAATIRDVETASLSDVGRVRSENQDACAEMQSPAGTRLLVVADGMGGHQGGSMVERIAQRSWQGSSSDGTTMSHETARPFLRDVHVACAKAGSLDLNLLRVGAARRAASFSHWHF